MVKGGERKWRSKQWSSWWSANGGAGGSSGLAGGDGSGGGNEGERGGVLVVGGDRGQSRDLRHEKEAKRSESLSLRACVVTQGGRGVCSAAAGNEE